VNKEVPERNGESKEPSERSTEEPRDEWLEWVERELAAGRNPGLIQQDDEGKEQEDADP